MGAYWSFRRCVSKSVEGLRAWRHQFHSMIGRILTYSYQPLGASTRSGPFQWDIGVTKNTRSYYKMTRTKIAGWTSAWRYSLPSSRSDDISRIDYDIIKKKSWKLELNCVGILFISDSLEKYSNFLLFFLVINHNYYS